MLPTMLRVEWLRSDGTQAHRWLDPKTPIMKIGRDPAHEVPVTGFDDVSRDHASFVLRDGAWHVFDTSRYGTAHLRGETAMEEGEPLRDGDIVRLADQVHLRVVDKVPPGSRLPDRTRGLARTRRRPGVASEAMPVVLTARQRDVLQTFAEDPTRTRDDVARLLGISVWGVRKHLKNAYRALELEPQRGGMIPLAVAAARQHGLLD